MLENRWGELPVIGPRGPEDLRRFTETLGVTIFDWAELPRGKNVTQQTHGAIVGPFFPTRAARRKYIEVNSGLVGNGETQEDAMRRALTRWQDGRRRYSSLHASPVVENVIAFPGRL